MYVAHVSNERMLLSLLTTLSHRCNRSSSLCNWRNVSKYSFFTDRSTFQISTCAGWLPHVGVGDYTSSNSFSHTPVHRWRWDQTWKVAQCIWFENPNVVLNIEIAECRWSLSSDSQYVGDPSSATHHERHRYRTTNRWCTVWMGLVKCVILKLLVGPSFPVKALKVKEPQLLLILLKQNVSMSGTVKENH